MQNLIFYSTNSHLSKDGNENIFMLDEEPRLSAIWVYLLSQTLIWVGIAALVFTLAVAS